MTTSAISQQIKALENQLKSQLFNRHPHSVTLTPAGQAYLPVVQSALTAMETGTDNLFGRVRQETLYVQSVLIFAASFLPPYLAQFSQLAPDINLQLTTGNSTADFRDQYADMQIVFGETNIHGRQSDRLMSEQLYPVARADIAASINSPSDLMTFPLIDVASHKSGWLQVIDQLQLRDTARRIYADNTLMAFARATSGEGVALARAPASSALQTQLGLQPCLENFDVAGSEAYFLTFASADRLTKSARRFRSFLRNVCDQRPLDAST